jgi:hypothetical protein
MYFIKIFSPFTYVWIKEIWRSQADKIYVTFLPYNFFSFLDHPGDFVV